MRRELRMVAFASRRAHAADAALRAAIVAATDAGVSSRAIADVLGVTHPTVLKIVREERSSRENRPSPEVVCRSAEGD